ncbi:Peroxisome biosynthesis protein [Podosphaera aphanis]|nr:Peroxisome biosynthesis protein [Podosphaera aphanis]
MQTVTAELSLVRLRSCFVNLPASLCSLLSDINALTQNVVVELNYHTHSSNSSLPKDAHSPRSVYVGWTGFQSKKKLGSIIAQDGLNGIKGNTSVRDQPVPIVEIDSTFARALNLVDGQKVTASLHLDPPVAHTINIEPLTPEDWEIIELHATFLELNLIAQIRALPNPKYIPLNSSKSLSHPLTLQLSPTSSANIIVTSLLPELQSSAPFARLAPDAEVIVAPKARTKPPRPHGESWSVTSKRSTGCRKKILREEARPALHLRGYDKSLIAQYFQNDEDSEAHSLKVWVERDMLLSKTFRGITWVSVTILKPPSLQPPIDPQKQQQEVENLGITGLVPSKVVARLMPWDFSPDSKICALSASLCASVACEGIRGEIVKLEPAPIPMNKATASLTNENELKSPKTGPKVIKIYPFSSEATKTPKPLKLDGNSKKENEEAIQHLMKMYSFQGASEPLFKGPLTDGLILGKVGNHQQFFGWEGGILRFDHTSIESEKQTCQWFLGTECKFSIEIQSAIPRPASISMYETMGSPLTVNLPNLVGIDSLIDQIRDHLLHMSSVLLTGAQGSGKSVLAQYLAHHLGKDYLFHTTYFSCRKAISDETRVFSLKENFNRVFRKASWCASLGGKSVVILDDLDKLCPVETELETSENGRSRQISEILSAVIKQFYVRDNGVVILATAQSKQSLHKVLYGGHIFREITDLKAPNKEERRILLETIVKQDLTNVKSNIVPSELPSNFADRPVILDGSIREKSGALTDTRKIVGHSGYSGTEKNGFSISSGLDFLDLAGETDGYMPRDLVLLVTRARSEALIRVVTEDSNSKSFWNIEITREDFKSAMKGFTPASLRNITLQTSTTTFDSIGGLRSTRKTLLETLQYPTTYAPIFAQCPLRLRSGLLLYGYPGCGKTLLASAVAGECGLNFISVKGPEILNKYIGASEKSVRDLFERAEAAKPCILFFDEFDSIAPKRGHDSTGVTDRVVNQLLTQMDGAEGLSGVYVLAATSRPDLIDPALLRPGRLDKSLICDLPDENDRNDILSALGKKLKLNEDTVENFDKLASLTEGYSGADLQALMYNAHLEAIHDMLSLQEDLGSRKTINGTNRRVSVRTKDPIKFLFSEENERLEVETRSKSGMSKSKILSERAAISTIQAYIKAQERCQKKGTVDDGINDNEKEPNKQEVVIEWRHMLKSLSSTKPSISPLERKRLAAIYREFLTARDGEVRNGDGGREVGGRASLM